MFRKNNFETILNKLKHTCNKSNCSYKHSSAIIHKNKVLSIGYNYHFNNISIHAEIDACKNYMKLYNCNDLKGVDIIVIRNNGDINSDIKMSKPCIHCYKFLSNKGVRKIYYSNENGEISSYYINDLKTEHISSYYRRNI